MRNAEGGKDVEQQDHPYQCNTGNSIVRRGRPAVSAQTDQPTTRDIGDDHGLGDWGLLGLAGLLGRNRKDRVVTDTCRV
jgi:hypothetical protein